MDRQEIQSELGDAMQLKRVYSNSNLASLRVNINEEVAIKGIGIRISGTAGATAPVVGDVGRLQYIKNGVTLVDCGFDSLLAFNDIMGGTPNRESTNSGVVDLYAYIPRRYLDNNVEHIVPSDNAQIQCTFGANLATRIASGGLVEVYLDLEKGVQLYDLMIRQYSTTISGASTTPIPIDQPNLAFIGLSATVSSVFTLTGSNITQVSYEIGGLSGDASLGALQDNTSFQFNIENLAGTASLVPYELMAALYTAAGDVTSKLFDNLRVGITTSGASVAELFAVGALFNEARLEQTMQKQRARLLDIANRKQASGDEASVATVQKVLANAS